jgi:hypothetical protein
LALCHLPPRELVIAIARAAGLGDDPRGHPGSRKASFSSTSKLKLRNLLMMTVPASAAKLVSGVTATVQWCSVSRRRPN